MIQISEIEFDAICQGLAGAHMLIQRIHPVLNQRHVALDKEQRELLKTAPAATSNAFTLIRTIAGREQSRQRNIQNTPMLMLSDLDTKLMRSELENVSALEMPDLTNEMNCAIDELPMLAEIALGGFSNDQGAAKLMAIAWGAGRRYGILQACAIFSNTIDEFREGTELSFETALNQGLTLPGIETEPGAGPQLVRHDYNPSQQTLDELDRVKDLAEKCAATPHLPKPN